MSKFEKKIMEDKNFKKSINLRKINIMDLLFEIRKSNLH